MIFVTTGTQLPFERLISAVQRWAKLNPKIKIFAQTCGTVIHTPHIQSKRLVSPSEYSALVKEATVMVAHAGIGTIVTAHEHNLPLIIMARKHELNEHRNNHQAATVKKFQNTIGIYIAGNDDELISLLDKHKNLIGCGENSPKSRTKLIDFIRNEIG
jgi:UDP-N-acetylglucosamine transferase subunit ALG13